MVCVCGHFAVAHAQPEGERCGAAGCGCVEFKRAVLLGVPVRTDATLCDPGEVFPEMSDGETVRVWPPEEP